MHEALEHSPLRATTLQISFEWFLRAVAAYSLILGLMYWVRLVGFYPGTDWRFDLMPVHWKVASVVLAVLFPFAASGLWMLASWGPVIWFLCAGLEWAMHLCFPELYGARPQVVFAHAGIALVYATFRAAFLIKSRRVAD